MSAVWAFLYTLLLELPFICLWLKKLWKEALLIGFLINLFTWPLLQVVHSITNIHILLLEFIVGLIEGYCYYLFFRKPLWQSLLIGITVNLFSFFIGLFIFRV
jgi:hypothetical protein